jgi:membrane-associated phospholipid phosphatase
MVGSLLTGLIMAATYFSANEIAFTRGVTVFDPAQMFLLGGRSLDSRIPYLPWTAVIYHIAYVALLMTPVLAYPRNEKGTSELFQLYSGVITISLAACTVFIVCPAEMTLRSSATFQHNASLWHEFNLSLYTIDRPFNTWPSLHVAQTGLVTLMMTHWLRRRSWAVFLWAVWAALVISTLTTKQHFIWDVITGSGLAAAYWQWKLRPINQSQ